MRLLDGTKDSRVFELSRDEVCIIRKSLSGALLYLSREAEDFFSARIGVKRECTKLLLNRIDAILDQNAPSMHCELAVSRLEAQVLVRSMDELANGFHIPEWEFETLTGFARATIRDLMNQMHLTLVSPVKELPR